MGQIFDESAHKSTPMEQIKRPLLKKPFFAYEPGAQRSHNYNMPVDAKEYRFGKRQTEVQPTVGECLTFAKGGASGPDVQTEICSKAVEDFKERNRDILGVSRTNTYSHKNRPCVGIKDAI